MPVFKYSLRAHHGMCLTFFRGKGYSQEFVDNMTFIQEDLASNPLVKIVAETEDICRYCPHNIDNKCSSFEQVLDYDKSVLKFCGLENGSVMLFSEFEKLVFEKILLPGNREKICGDCQWSDFCH